MGGLMAGSSSIADGDAEFLVNMSASADVLAMAKVEVDLSAIPEGKNVRSTTRPRFAEENTSLTCSKTGRHQVARKARLRSPPHPGRD